MNIILPNPYLCSTCASNRSYSSSSSFRTIILFIIIILLTLKHFFVYFIWSDTLVAQNKFYNKSRIRYVKRPLLDSLMHNRGQGDTTFTTAFSQFACHLKTKLQAQIQYGGGCKNKSAPPFPTQKTYPQDTVTFSYVYQNPYW